MKDWFKRLFRPDPVISYTVVRQEKFFDFDAECTDLVIEGWEPIGGVSTCVFKVTTDSAALDRDWETIS